ncbi:MAG: hypothetical protein ACOC70_01700 [bacterium]
MNRKAIGWVLIAAGVAWMVALVLFTHVGLAGERRDFLGLPYPRDVFSYRARRRVFHPHHFSRFRSLHFYVSWVGTLVPVGLGMCLVRKGRS